MASNKLIELLSNLQQTKYLLIDGGRRCDNSGAVRSDPRGQEALGHHLHTLLYLIDVREVIPIPA